MAKSDTVKILYPNDREETVLVMMNDADANKVNVVFNSDYVNTMYSVIPNVNTLYIMLSDVLHSVYLFRLHSIDLYCVQ